MGTAKRIKMMVAAGRSPNQPSDMVRVFDCEAAKGRFGIGQVRLVVFLTVVSNMLRHSFNVLIRPTLIT